jgi:hypothetical protein
MPTNAELTAQLAEMTKRATDAEARTASLTTDLATANERADQEAKARQEVGLDLDRSQQELRELRASLKAFKGSATKAKNEITVLKKQLSPEARKLGAMKPAKSPEEAAARAEALEAAFAADTTELVFSDGQREIRELAPRVITGDAWRVTPSGRVLNHEPILEPGDCQREQVSLRGFALLDEAGEQVAYSALPDAIVIGRNQQFLLPHNTIRF